MDRMLRDFPRLFPAFAHAHALHDDKQHEEEKKENGVDTHSHQPPPLPPSAASVALTWHGDIEIMNRSFRICISVSPVNAAATNAAAASSSSSSSSLLPDTLLASTAPSLTAALKSHLRIDAEPALVRLMTGYETLIKQVRSHTRTYTQADNQHPLCIVYRRLSHTLFSLCADDSVFTVAVLVCSVGIRVRTIYTASCSSSEILWSGNEQRDTEQ